MIYTFTARDESGQIITDVLEAKDTRELMDKLRQRKMTVTKVVEGGKGGSSAQTKKGFNFLVGKGKIKTDNIIVFSRQLATMIDSGLPLVHSLDILQRQAASPAFQEVILKIKEDVEIGGQPLSTALGKHSNVFSGLFVNMVKAGEMSGTLDNALTQLAGYMESSGSIVRKVKSAATYPVMIGGMAGAIGLALLIFIVPMFAGIYKDFGGDLPVITKLMVIASDFIRKDFIILIGGFIGIAVGGWRFYKSDKGKTIVDKLSLKLPIVGPIVRKIAISKVTRTLGTLIQSGVSILDALIIVGKTSGNKVIEKAIDTAQSRVRQGESITKPLADTGVFPPMVTEMISVGEETGELEKMLTKVADFYDQEVDAAISSLTSTLEPVMMLGLGVIVGGMVIGLYLPIFKLSSVVGG